MGLRAALGGSVSPIPQLDGIKEGNQNKGTYVEDGWSAKDQDRQEDTIKDYEACAHKWKSETNDCKSFRCEECKTEVFEVGFFNCLQCKYNTCMDCFIGEDLKP